MTRQNVQINRLHTQATLKRTQSTCRKRWKETQQTGSKEKTESGIEPIMGTASLSALTLSVLCPVTHSSMYQINAMLLTRATHTYTISNPEHTGPARVLDIKLGYSPGQRCFEEGMRSQCRKQMCDPKCFHEIQNAVSLQNPDCQLTEPEIRPTNRTQNTQLAGPRKLSAHRTQKTSSLQNPEYLACRTQKTVSSQKPEYCQITEPRKLSAHRTQNTVSSQKPEYCQLTEPRMLSANRTQNTVSSQNPEYCQLTEPRILSLQNP